MKTLITFVLIFIIFNHLRAQERHTNSLWTRISLTKNITPKWNILVDFQHRRLSNFLTGSNNPLEVASLNSARIWLFYKLPKDYAIVVVPFLYFRHGQLRQNNLDEINFQIMNELRWKIGVQKIFKTKKVEFRTRFLHEYRWFDFDNSLSRWVQRTRVLGQVQTPVFQFTNKNKILGALTYEYFANTTSLQNVFTDQQRFFATFTYQTQKNIDYALGFQYIRQPQANFVLNQSVLMTYVTIKL